MWAAWLSSCQVPPFANLTLALSSWAQRPNQSCFSQPLPPGERGSSPSVVPAEGQGRGRTAMSSTTWVTRPGANLTPIEPSITRPGGHVARLVLRWKNSERRTERRWEKFMWCWGWEWCAKLGGRLSLSPPPIATRLASDSVQCGTFIEGKENERFVEVQITEILSNLSFLISSRLSVLLLVWISLCIKISQAEIFAFLFLIVSSLRAIKLPFRSQTLLACKVNFTKHFVLSYVRFLCLNVTVFLNAITEKIYKNSPISILVFKKIN